MYKEIPAVVVAVVQYRRRAIEAGRNLLERGAEFPTLCCRQRFPFALFQAPFDKVFKLPEEEALIEPLLPV